MVGVGVALPVGVGVALPVGVGVALPVGVGVALPVGVGVTLRVGVGVTFPVGAGVGVDVGLMVGVAVGLKVGDTFVSAYTLTRLLHVSFLPGPPTSTSTHKSTVIMLNVNISFFFISYTPLSPSKT